MSGFPRRTVSSPQSSQSQSPSPRYSGAHSNSSAFSKNAQPNEDWTQVSDLAERRRIQNRIAQRNYRQKLKRRLEELEHRKDSQSASPEPSPSRDDIPGSSNSGERRVQSEGPSSSSRGQFDVQHLNLFGQPFDDDSRMLGYQFCAQPSPPPPPSPPLPDQTGYSTMEHSRFSPHAPQFSTWQQPSQPATAPQFYSAAPPVSSAYYEPQMSPNLSTTSTPPRTETQFWSRQQDSWSNWGYSPHNEQATMQSQLQSWQQSSPNWHSHYQDASSSKMGDDNMLGWGHHEGLPTPPHSADLINPMINPFEDFLVDSA